MNTTITILGSGVIGTALGNILASKPDADVVLHSIEPETVAEINQEHMNSRYFPTFRLHDRLRATLEDSSLSHSDIIFLAIPSSGLLNHVLGLKSFIRKDALVINLAKGFGSGNKTVCQCMEENFPNPILTLKGPSFAREIINQIPTAFTLGYKEAHHREKVSALFKDTTIFTDYSKDIHGVELLSILKNMYAIVMGIIDAQFNSPNLRFMILTKAFREMRRILVRCGGKEDTMFLYCGYGDFTLTSLNDLSRNRTLGLLIGKGFLTDTVSGELVLEGRTAVEVFRTSLSADLDVRQEFPIVDELHRLFSSRYDISTFVKNILRVEEP